MPVLASTEQSKRSSGTATIGWIVAAAFIVTICGLVFTCFARKRLRERGKHVAQCLLALLPSSPAPLPTASRGGATYPTSTSRKWKFWKQTNADGDLYSGTRGAPLSPTPSPGAPPRHVRSVSASSGESDGGLSLPVLSIPPPAYSPRGPTVLEAPTRILLARPPAA